MSGLSVCLPVLYRLWLPDELLHVYRLASEPALPFPEKDVLVVTLRPVTDPMTGFKQKARIGLGLDAG